MTPIELQKINIKDPEARANLAIRTKDRNVLIWLAPDIEENVIINIINNPLFDREIYDRFQLEHLYTTNILNLLSESNVPPYEDQVFFQQKLEKSYPLSDTFCPIPWNHISTFTNGDLRACCQMVYKPYGKLNINVKDVENVNEVRNAPFLKELRKSMMHGKKHPACRQCWTEESNNLQSRRMGQNIAYNNLNSTFHEFTKEDGTIDTKNIPLNYLDLRLGNKCNLACRSCGPADSSLWYKDYYDKVGDHVNYYDIKKYDLIKDNGKVKLNSDDLDWPDKTLFLEKILDNIQDVDRFYFTGGEPTINVNHIIFLEKLIAKGVANRIKLDYNSNAISLPERLLNIWPNFASVGIGFSIDAIEEQFEYMRYPGKWPKVIKTIQKIHKYAQHHGNISCIFSPTISMYNITNILSLQEFSMITPHCFRKEMPVHFLEKPDYLNITILPEESKNIISKKINNWISNIGNINIPYYKQSKVSRAKDLIVNNMSGIISYMNNFNPDNNRLMDEFFYETETLDRLRNNNWKKTFPFLQEILNK